MLFPGFRWSPVVQLKSAAAASKVLLNDPRIHDLTALHISRRMPGGITEHYVLTRLLLPCIEGVHGIVVQHRKCMRLGCVSFRRLMVCSGIALCSCRCCAGMRRLRMYDTEDQTHYVTNQLQVRCSQPALHTWTGGTRWL